MTDLMHWEQDKALYLFTSLTAGSSHVITATSRIETILRAARIPFTYIDTATNESAKKLYQRRGKGRKLPFLVKEGIILGGLDDIEEWNEFGELKEVIGEVSTSDKSITTTPAKAPAIGSSQPASITATPTKQASTEAPISTTTTAPKENVPGGNSALRQLAFESAAAAVAKKAASGSSTTKPAQQETTSPTVSVGESPTSPVGVASPTKIPLPASPLPAGVRSPSIASSLHRAGSQGSSSSSQFIPEHYDPPPTTHRGSSVSIATEAEIKEIECREVILEEDEGEEEEVKKSTATPTKPATVIEKAKEKVEDATATVEQGLKDLKVTDEKEEEKK